MATTTKKMIFFKLKFIVFYFNDDEDYLTVLYIIDGMTGSDNTV